MYLCGMLKCDAIDGGPEMTPDDKAFCQIKIIGAPLSLTHVNFYPRLIRIEVRLNYFHSIKIIIFIIIFSTKSRMTIVLL